MVTHYLVCEQTSSLFSVFLFVLLRVHLLLLFIPLFHNVGFIYLFFLMYCYLNCFSVLLCLFISTSFLLSHFSFSFYLSPVLCRSSPYLCLFPLFIVLRFALLTQKFPNPFLFGLEGNTISVLGLA